VTTPASIQTRPIDADVGSGTVRDPTRHVIGRFARFAAAVTGRAPRARCGILVRDSGNALKGAACPRCADRRR
jgi:hypothetical protein